MYEIIPMRMSYGQSLNHGFKRRRPEIKHTLLDDW
jgi:hypothetical protein